MSYIAQSAIRFWGSTIEVDFRADAIRHNLQWANDGSFVSRIGSSITRGEQHKVTAEGTREESLLSADEAMATLGIRCVPVDYFHYGNYRYTNLKDAVAQATRDRLMAVESGHPVSPGTQAAGMTASLEAGGPFAGHRSRQ